MTYQQDICFIDHSVSWSHSSLGVKITTVWAKSQKGDQLTAKKKLSTIGLCSAGNIPTNTTTSTPSTNYQ